VFSYVYDADADKTSWRSTNANFGTATDLIEIAQFSGDKLALELTETNPTSIDCYVEFDIVYDLSLTDSSVLKYESQTPGDGVESYCPTFSGCVRNCRQEYTVTSSSSDAITLKSSFADTADCVCPTVTFTKNNNDEFMSQYLFGLSLPSGGAGFSNGDSELWQNSPSALRVNIFTENSDQGTVTDCMWKYSISDAPSPSTTPSPTTTPSSSSTSKLKVLAGLFSATFVALTLA